MHTQPDKPIYAEERKIAIVKELKNGALSVTELANIFNVSPTTIRNDLRDLERQGQLVRTHGGAMMRQQTGIETPMDERNENVDAKQAIAKMALECIEDGDTLVLDAGTTTYALAQLIGIYRQVRIVTNDLKIASLADEYPNLDIFMLGGKVRAGYHCVVGAAAVRNLSTFSADRVFLGTNGFDLQFGASTPDVEQAEMKRAMLESAAKNYILCDHTKFGKRSFTCFANFNEIDAIVIDQIARGNLRNLENAGLEVYAEMVIE